MNFLVINFFLISILLLTTFYIFKTTSLISIVALTGIFTLVCAAIYVNLDAVDVAFTEAAVGSGISTILMVMAVAKLPEGKKNQLLNFFPSIVLSVSIVIVLMLIIANLPLLGDPNAPIHLHVTPEYIKESKSIFHIPNVVTNILASYRGFDTLGETIVIFTAGLGVIVLLTSNTLNRKTKFKKEGKKIMKDDISSSPILNIVSRILFAPIIIFGLYVQFHGDYGPGGGFQAGVIIAAAFILYSMIFGIKKGETLVPVKINQYLMCFGVLLYAGVGIVSIFLNGNYLDYNVLASDRSSGQHIGIILVELGVGITVATVMIALYHSFASFRIKDD